MRRRLYIVLPLLMLALSAPAYADDNTSRGVFLSACSFRTGEKAVLTHNISEPNQFHLIVRDRNGTSDLSDISIETVESITIDTNGGVGKHVGVDAIFHQLLRRAFMYANATSLNSVLLRKALPCGMEYPF